MDIDRTHKTSFAPDTPFWNEDKKRDIQNIVIDREIPVT